MGILGKLAKGTAKVAGKVIKTAHDPRKFGTEEQYYARGIERKVKEDIVFKAMPKILNMPVTTIDEEKEDEIIVLKTGGRSAMKTFKLVLRAEDGSSVWINVNYIVKMTKTREGNYYIYLLNGERYLIDHRTASAVESCFEG